MVIINGKRFKGNNLTIKNNKVYIDGKLVEDDVVEEKNITINIEGDIEKVKVDNCNLITVNGDCGSISTTNGDVKTLGNINGNVSTTNGNVRASTISGDVSTVNGDIN